MLADGDGGLKGGHAVFCDPGLHGGFVVGRGRPFVRQQQVVQTGDEIELDLPALVGLQARMLDALWPLIRPGGLLVYATCSLLDQENAAQISAFLARHGDAQDDTPPDTGDVPVTAGAQLLSGTGQHDGFYIARLRKR